MIIEYWHNNLRLHFEFPGVSFSLRGTSIPTDGSVQVLISHINPNGENDEDALICRSEIPISGIGNWYLHPTQMSIDDDDRIMNPVNGTPDRGWKRNRGSDPQDLRLVRLKKVTDTAEEGVFTCHISGDNNTPRYLYITYSCSCESLV